MQNVFESLIAILYESAPYLLVGFGLAGLIHVALTRFPRVTATLTGTGRRPIVWAALIGLPMSLCSCSVLPAARALRREGASKGATASFLVSVPETDVVSIFATFAMIGPLFAIYRPFAALLTALATGFVVRAIEMRELRNARPVAAAPAAAHSTDHDACCDDGNTAPVATSKPWWKRALRYGYIDVFDDIAPQLVLGIVIAAVIGTWLPSIDPKLYAGGTVLSYLIMIAMGAPLQVCASASTPIAAGLIAGGVSPGAAMVFLISGPATNFASFIMIRNELGTRGLVGYLVSIVAVSVACGVALDAFVDRFTLPVFEPSHVHASHSPLALVATVVFLALVAWSFQRTRLLPHAWSRVRASCRSHGQVQTPTRDRRAQRSWTRQATCRKRRLQGEHAIASSPSSA
jgi:uncharacterized membrane protein YraQ (UPF0718 family)